MEQENSAYNIYQGKAIKLGILVIIFTLLFSSLTYIVFHFAGWFYQTNTLAILGLCAYNITIAAILINHNKQLKDKKILSKKEVYFSKLVAFYPILINYNITLYVTHASAFWAFVCLYLVCIFFFIDIKLLIKAAALYLISILCWLKFCPYTTPSDSPQYTSDILTIIIVSIFFPLMICSACYFIEKFLINAKEDQLKNHNQKLEEILKRTYQYIEKLNQSAIQLKETAKELESASDSKVAACQQVTTAIEEMAQSISQNAENTESSSNISQNTLKTVEKSNQAVEKTSSSMKEIQSKVLVINEIAAKTDLLAVNAGIEAARAGEYGEGFAVVALEIRKLAEITQKSAKDIHKFIKKGILDAEESKVMLKELMPEINKTTNIIKEIAVSCREQNTGANQVSRAINDLNQTTEIHAQMSKKVESAAENLESLTQELKNIIEEFSTNSFDELTNQVNELTQKIEKATL